MSNEKLNERFRLKIPLLVFFFQIKNPFLENYFSKQFPMKIDGRPSLDHRWKKIELRRIYIETHRAQCFRHAPLLLPTERKSISFECQKIINECNNSGDIEFIVNINRLFQVVQKWRTAEQAQESMSYGFGNRSHLPETKVTTTAILSEYFV